MAWRNIVINKACKISLKNDNFLYSPMKGDEVVVPLNEISVIVLETKQVSITNALLSKLAQNNIALFSCDEKHIPNGIFMPFHQHSRFSLMLHLQTKWSEPFKKRLWRQIISQKIANQAFVLKIIGKEQEYNELINISKNIKSGDKDNKESLAAKLYFSYLFANFNRKNASDWRNLALNYGYSIIRGAIARDLSASGFMPALGICHKNQLNSFNLADDLIEPFRAFVDLEVYKMYKNKISSKANKLLSDQKIELVKILHKSIKLKEEKTILLNGCSVFVNSLAICTKNNDSQDLIMPRFLHEKS